MEAKKKSFRERRQDKHDEHIRKNLRVSKLGHRFFSIAIRVFMALLVCGGGAMVFQCLWKIVTTGQPLVINHESSTWGGTAGFMGGMVGMLLFSLAFLWFILRRHEEFWAETLERIEPKT